MPHNLRTDLELMSAFRSRREILLQSWLTAFQYYPPNMEYWADLIQRANDAQIALLR